VRVVVEDTFFSGPLKIRFFSGPVHLFPRLDVPFERGRNNETNSRVVAWDWDGFSPPRQYNRKNLKITTRTLSLYRYSAMNIVYTKIKITTRTLSFI